MAARARVKFTCYDPKRARADRLTPVAVRSMWGFVARHRWKRGDESTYVSPPFLAGVFNFNEEDRTPRWGGIALFPTRKAARDAARRAGVHGRPVRMRITVELEQ